MACVLPAGTLATFFAVGMAAANVARADAPPTDRRRYESTVRGERAPATPPRRILPDEAARVPGTLGDPVRAVVSLPGVSAPVPLVPFFSVRGGVPGTTGFFVDGIRVPELFHPLVGGGAVHAETVGSVDFTAGGYDASWGRYTGGIIDVQTRRLDGEAHAAVELRPYEGSLYAASPFWRDGEVVATARYGDPGPLLRLLDPNVDLAYWDYFVRAEKHGVSVEALGSSDDLELGDRFSDLPTSLRLAFHRVQVRARGRAGNVAGEAAIVGGFDETQGLSSFAVEKLSLAARAVGSIRLPKLRLRGGLDGELSRFTSQLVDAGGATIDPVGPDLLGDLGADRTGLVGGAFVQADATPLAGVAVSAGVRTDVFHAGAVTDVGLDPRFAVRVQALPRLALGASVGVYHQAPSFPVPLPGLDTFALALGLQRSIQWSSTIDATLPFDFTLSLAGWFQALHDATEAPLGHELLVCASPPPPVLTGYPALILRQVDGESFGGELMLRRSIGPVSGWIAYTVGRAERSYRCGIRPDDQDQTHVLNVVVQAHLPWRLEAGARFHYATGRPYTVLDPLDPAATLRADARMPDYTQIDLRIERAWTWSRGTVAVLVEVVNLTWSTTIVGVYYPGVHSGNPLGPPEFFAVRWSLPAIGVRGTL